MFKKVAGIISLLIMVITQILTPYAYAVSGDVIDIDEKNERIIEEQEQETNEQETKDQDEDKTEYITEENMETVSFEEDQYSGDDELSLTGDDVCAQKGDNELTGTNGLLTGNIFTGSEVVGNEEILSNLSGTYLTGVDNNPGFAENQIENKEYLSGNEDDDFISNEIYGSGEYDGVRVEVYADTGLFQSGTELVIEPIKWFKLRSLKNDLIEEKEEITKDSAIVAFNISFIYSGEEVQPLSGKTVSVTFNYEKNEDLKQAEEDESQEIKIYHINDKDEEGNKLDENEVEKIDIVENNEGKIVVEAENFSIYTIVTQVAEEGPLAENENQLANFVYGEISIARPDDLSSADYPKEGFTIMDRNLGAITTGAGAGASTGSYGYHYQWGNNYGFDANKDKSEMITSSVKVDVSGLTEYNSGTFIISNITNDSNARTDTWMKSDNNNLWHGDKIQGPCPNGWHIPSVEELNHLLIYWAKSNNIGWTLNSNLVKLNGGHSKVSNDLYIPYAGARNYDASFLNRGNLGIFWSYSINGSNKLPYDFFTTNKNNPNETYIRNSDGRIRGISVRCFKDTYSGTGDMFTVTYDFNGGSGSVVNQMVKSGDIAERPIDPIKSGYDFKGWYISGTNTQYDFSKKVTDDKELYAKYREICGEGYVSDGEQCILQSSVTYLKKGGDFKSILTFLAGSNPINIIERSDNEPVGQTGLLSTSGLPVIAWYELSEDGTGTIYYKTDATTIFMNSDSSYMFNNFRKLKRVNLDGFNSSKVTTMQLMFDYCFDLEELDVSNRDTSNVTNMANMFSRTQNLKHLNLSNFDTSNVTTMYAMFLETSVLEELDLSSFDTSSVKNMSNMFVKSGISTLIFGDHFDTSSVTNMSSMFSTLANLQELDLSGFDTSAVTDMSSMFWASKKLNRINLSSFSTSSVINMKQMFEYCNSLEDLDVSSFDTSNVTNMANMFARMHKLKHLNLSNFDTSKVTSMSEMFLETSVLEELDLSSFDTSLVSNMTKMFLNSGISTLIFGDHFDTSSVTNMSSMFSTLANLQELDLSGFDTSAVTDMSSMFWSSRKLNKINLSGFNTSSVTNMKQMFEYCYALEELDVSSFDTSSVTDMSNMFSRLHSLKHLNLSNFDTSKVTSMKEMFLEGYLLEELDLSSFDTSSVINMSSMFKDTKILKYIYVSPLFTGDQVTSSATMFSNTYKIIGGNGTKYDSSNIDISYAHVDDENNSGYFTDPNNFTVRFISGNSIAVANLTGRVGSPAPKLEGNYTYYSDEQTTILYDFNQNLSGYTEIYVKEILKSELVAGENFNSILDTLANGKSNIKHIVRSYNINDINANAEIISTNKYDTPIYAWFDDEEEIIYYYTEAGIIYMNSLSNSMFRWFENLIDVDLSGFNTSNVTKMQNMFENCYKLQSLDLSGFDTSNVTDMTSMFLNCNSLAYLNVSSWNTSKVTSMQNMFNNCNNLEGLDLSSFRTPNVTHMGSMFNKCYKIVSLDLSGFDTSKVKSMASMFSNMVNLEEIDVSNWDVGVVTDMSNMFNNCKKLTSLNLGSFVTSNVKDMTSMFIYCSKLTNLDISNFDTKSVTTMQNMFNGLESIQSLDLRHFDTSSVKNMNGMFSKSYALKNINLSGWNTNSVINMGYMFSYLTQIESLDVSSLDTANVTDMSSMFTNCYKLKELNLSNFITSSAIYMDNMFNHCDGLTYLDLSNFDTSNVTKMTSMFIYCSGLTGLNLSSFDTSKVTTMQNMFANCSNIGLLDLGSFDTSSVKNMNGMFNQASSLKTVYASDKFTTGSVTDSNTMFSYSTLVGGNGTKKTVANIDNATFAQIDNETQSGYFTDPSHFAVSFLSSTGLEIAKQWISTGSTIAELNDPSKEYEYYTDSNLTIPYNTGTELYAYTGIYVKVTSKFKVEFNTMGGTPEVDSQWISSGGTATEIDESLLPKKGGYLFSGWYISGTDTKFDFSQAITEDKSLYAKWNLKICVTYAPIQGTNNIKITGLLGEEGCERNLTIPSHIDGKPVTYIEGGFKDIKILEGRLTIPDTVTSIGGNAFWNAFKTTDQTLENTLVLGTGLESIGKAAFRNNNFTGQLVLPDTLTGGISETAFYNNKFNGELVIPKGITYIDAKSFENNKFSKVDFSKTINLKSIWGEAFRGMNSLEGELRIPDSVESIHGSAFWGAFKTTNQTKENTLKLGTGLKYIYDHAFRDNNFTGELILPDLLTGTIGKAAFYNNKFNGELIIPKGITKILEEAFRYNKFNRIDWNKAKDLESIGNNSFREMYSLEGELRIPDTVTSVGFSSFWRAFKTTNQTLENKLILGTGLKSIGENAFRSNKFTGELILPDILTGVIGRAAFYDNSFTGELIIPKGITEISRESFRYNNLTKINFEKTENLKTIGQDSFRENKIALLTDIPSSVEIIGDSAFYSNNIDEIDFISGNVTIGGNAFCSNGTVNGYQNLATINTASPDCVTWQGKYPYNVTYVTYGGEPSTGEIVLYGDTITNISPIKTGYEFKGWYLTGDNFFPNTTPITGDLTLYAKFQKDIVFKIIGNGNKILSGSEEVDEYTLTGTVFNTDDEYSFTFPQIRPNIRTPYSMGYSTGADMYTGTYHSGDTVTLTGSMTYYAQSKQVYSNHIGTFITGTGVESLGPTNKQEIELDCTPEITYNGNRYDKCTITSPVINPVPGYENAKYYRGGTGYDQNSDIDISGDVTFIAIANLITYTINYILNGGELLEQKLSYTTEERFSIANPTRIGYEFLGWTGTTLTDITKNLYINTGTYGDLTLYANWIPNIYKIIYTHSGEQTEQLINYDEEISLNPNTFEKEGYLFSGWYDETYDVRYRDSETIKNLTTTSGDTFTLKAEWNPINYTVTFHSNTGEDETLVQLFTYDEGAKALVKNIFINTGYIFKSWNTEELGTGIKYEDEEEVSNLTSVNNTTINLYAQWNKLSKVEFKDGENLLTGYIVESGTEIELPENPSKPGYEFVKWNSLPEDMIVRGEDIVITAEWKATAPKEQQASAGGGRRIEDSNNQEHHSADNQSANTGDNKTNNSAEDMQTIYEWAYQHNITTLPSLERANPDGTVKRGHLAKMIVNYANNVLGREIPEKIPAECSWNDRKTDRESQEIKDYAVKACALGLMGLDMPKFLPNMEVTRAQFGTIMSRLLWGKKYAGGTPYYRRHLNALKENNIMTQIENSESRVEIRKRVWLMLMRSSKNN